MNRRDFLKASIAASITPVLSPINNLIKPVTVAELWADDVLLAYGPMSDKVYSSLKFNFKEFVEATIKVVLRIPEPVTGRVMVLERFYGENKDHRTGFCQGESFTINCPPVRAEGDNVLFGTPEELEGAVRGGLNSAWNLTGIV